MPEKYYLVDSHVLYWALFEEAKLRPTERDIISSPAHIVCASTATLWELNLKAGLGKLFLPENFLPRLEPAGYTILPIAFPHIETYRRLPPLHRDPFDRMLIAQAIAEGCTIITRDPDIQRYPVKTLED